MARRVSPSREYEIIVLFEQLGEQTKRQLAAVFASHANIAIRFLEVPPDIRATVARFDSACAWPRLIFHRLFLADLLPEYDKLILLGVDTLVRCDLATLYDIELGHSPLAAAPDVAAPVNTRWRETWLRHGLPVPDPYFNFDVQLQNLCLWRENAIAAKTFELVLKYRFSLQEQDALNLLVADKWLKLGCEWNFQLPQFRFFCPEDYDRLPEKDKTEGETLLQTGAYNIIHYPGAKPWALYEGAPAPLADTWWQTALQTPGFDVYFAGLLRGRIAELEAALRKHNLRRFLCSPRVRRRREQKMRGIRAAIAHYVALLHECHELAQRPIGQARH